MDRSDPQRPRPGDKSNADPETHKPSGEQQRAAAAPDESSLSYDPVRFGESEADAAERSHFDHLERETTQPARRYVDVPIFDQQRRPAPLNREPARPVTPPPAEPQSQPEAAPTPAPEPAREAAPVSRSSTFEPQPFAVPRPSDRPLPQVPRWSEPSPPAQPSQPEAPIPEQAAAEVSAPVVQQPSTDAAPETETQEEVTVPAAQPEPLHEPPVAPVTELASPESEPEPEPEPDAPVSLSPEPSVAELDAEPGPQVEPQSQVEPQPQTQPEAESETATAPGPMADAAPAAAIHPNAPPPLPAPERVAEPPLPPPAAVAAPPPLPPAPVAQSERETPPVAARPPGPPPQRPEPSVSPTPPALPGDQPRWDFRPDQPPGPPPAAPSPLAPEPPPVPCADPSFDFAVRPASAVDADAPPAPIAPDGRDWRALARRTAHALFLIFAGWFIAVLLLILAYRFINPPISMLMAQRFLTGSSINKQWAPIDRISPNLQRAVIVAEDGRFCQHWGVDFIEAANALRRASDGYPRGASTITMQVAKNLFLLPTKSYLRKAVEIPLTFAIELAWSKRRILEVYLNIVEWGPGVFGAEAASRAHFRRSAASLSQRQAAQLAAVLPNPIVRDAGSPGPRTARKASVIQSRAARARSASACVDNPR